MARGPEKGVMECWSAGGSRSKVQGARRRGPYNLALPPCAVRRVPCTDPSFHHSRVPGCRLRILGALALLLQLLFGADGLSAREAGEGSSGFVEEHLDWSMRLVTFGMSQDPAESSQNPGNMFLRLPEYRYNVEARPDVTLNWERLHASAKPRMELSWRRWEGVAQEDDTSWKDDWFVNEWLIRIRVLEGVFVSYGRENLQWGPCYLVSPSNPFFRDNGRGNPRQEVPGMDFARVVWLPDPAWTLSGILNTDEGRQPIQPALFKKTTALKLDYTGQAAYAGMILSHRERDRSRLGVFGGWTATDALLIYGEGVMHKGTDALYPQADRTPLGASMTARYENDSSLKGTVLVGGAYTLESGPTLSLEYVYHSPGYDDEEAEVFYGLRDRAAQAFQGGQPTKGLAAMTLSQTADPGLRFLRRHHLMAQYHHSNIWNVLHLTFRWTQNLEDHSGQFVSIVEYTVGDHVTLFSIGTVNRGNGNTEYGSIMDYQWMLGVEYAF